MKYFIHLWLATMLAIILAVSCTLSSQEPADASAAGLAPSGTATPAVTAPGLTCDGPYEVWVADYPQGGDGRLGSGTAEEALARLGEERDLAGVPRIAGETTHEVIWQFLLEGETTARVTARPLAGGSWGVVSGWSCVRHAE